MKLGINNALLLRLMTFVPPFLGIVIFSYIVKFSHNVHVSERLPLYQGVSSYYSLILIGFTYIKDRQAIKGRKIILPLVFVIILPLIGYYLVHMAMVITALMVTVSFLSSSILYLLLIKKKMFSYLLFSIANSILLPISLIASYFVFGLLIVFLLGILFYVYQQVKDDLTLFSYKNGGIDILNSIFLHSPYVLLPFFDFMIQAAIGVQGYSNYVLVNKYVNGGITLLFSYKQLSLMFSGELKRMNIILLALGSILALSALGVFINNWIVFTIMIGLYSFGVNLSSLIVRSQLMTGVYFWSSLIGVVFVALYLLGLYLFKDNISENKNFFVFFMSISTIIPSFLILFSNRRVNIKN